MDNLTKKKYIYFLFLDLNNNVIKNFKAFFFPFLAHFLQFILISNQLHEKKTN